MNRTPIALALAGAVLGLAGCTAAPAGPAVEGAEPGAYALWPSDVVEFPDIPVVDREARQNDCFQPEGTFVICTAEFEDTEANLAELDQLFTDAGFDGGLRTGSTDFWEYSQGQITILLSRSGEPEPGFLSLDLSDRS